MLTFYGYAKCSTCNNAKRALAKLGRDFKELDITVSPPSESELRDLIATSGRPYTDFLNRSGVQYRELNMKERVRSQPEAAIVALLASNGRLIKRPIVSDGSRVTVGFSPAEFAAAWGR